MSEKQHHYDNLDRIDYPLVEEDSTIPTLSDDVVRTEVRAGLLEIRDFITTDDFVFLLQELYDLTPEDRDEFVRSVILDEDELRKRRVVPPEGIKLQRSQFGDQRPTIFAVTKLMSDGVRKVTYTFDSDLELAGAGA